MRKLILIAAALYTLTALFMLSYRFELGIPLQQLVGVSIPSNSLPDIINQVTAAQTSSSTPTQLLIYILGIVIFAFGVIHIHKHRKKIKINVIMKALSIVQLFVATFIISVVLLGLVLPASTTFLEFLISLVPFFVLDAMLGYLLWIKDYKYLNLTSGIITLGFSMILALVLSPIFLFVLLFVLCFYDLIAVFVTKHMQAMVGAVMEKDLLPLMFIEGSIEAYKKKIESLNQTKPVFPAPIKLASPLHTITKKVMRASALGTGDILFPGALIGSLAFSGSTLFLTCIVGGILGVLLDFIWAKKLGQIPALPLILVGMAIASLPVLILTYI